MLWYIDSPLYLGSVIEYHGIYPLNNLIIHWVLLACASSFDLRRWEIREVGQVHCPVFGLLLVP